MTLSTSTLDTFNFLELLYMLADQGRSGVLTVYHPSGQFQTWLDDGRVKHMQFGDLLGTTALAKLLNDPIGRFEFGEGIKHPDPFLDASLDEIALEALATVPMRELAFEGPARITSPERVAKLRWTLKEQIILQQIESQRPLSDLVHDPEAKLLLQKLNRIGLLTQRRLRVARLTIDVTRQVSNVVLVDEIIFNRWQDDLVRQPQKIIVRTKDNLSYTLKVRHTADIGNQLLIPPELLMRTALRAGDSVLVRPL